MIICCLFFFLKIGGRGRNFLAVQWLGLRVFTAEAWGSIHGWETKILQAKRCGQKQTNNHRKHTGSMLFKIHTNVYVCLWMASLTQWT